MGQGKQDVFRPNTGGGPKAGGSLYPGPGQKLIVIRDNKQKPRNRRGFFYPLPKDFPSQPPRTILQCEGGGDSVGELYGLATSQGRLHHGKFGKDRSGF